MNMDSDPAALLAVDRFLRDCRGGAPVPRALRRRLEGSFSADLSDLRILRSSGVELLHAPAAAAGDLVIVHPAVWSGFDCAKTMHLVAHEIAHVLQQREGRVKAPAGGTGSLVFDAACEAEAELLADRVVEDLNASSADEGASTGTGPRAWHVIWNRTSATPRRVIQAHPANGIIRRAMMWLGKRSAKALSKHIAAHTRRNFEKAIHSVFRSVNSIRPLVNQTLKEGLALTEHFAQSTGTEMVEREGVRLTRQASRTPGKVRWLLQKEFRSAVGTKGERVLCLVLDMSGRLVTAFPADKLTLILGVVAFEFFAEKIANATENVAFETERLEKFKEMQRSKIDLWDFVPGIGEIWGGSLNEFEDLELAFDRWVDTVVQDVIASAEWDASSCFGGTIRATLEEVVRTGLGLPTLLEHEQ